jgi:hypothetical protein
MITPKELLEKAERPFFKIISSQLKGESVFPWVIPSNKQITGSNFSDWRNDLIPLYQQSKAAKGKGYTVEWKEKTINGSKQNVPVKIYFETFEDYLHCIGRRNDYDTISGSQKSLISTFPQLKEWTENNPSALLKYQDIWTDIVQVCKYFANNKPPHHFYLRELPIPVHSKFIEDNSAILKKLLDTILSPDWVNVNETDFTLRYGLRKPNVHTQIRVLDDELKPVLGYEECSLPLDDAAWLKWLPEKVFIIENQVCYLTFPKVENAVAIFGEGFKSRLTKHIPWLEKTTLFCWFDLDAAGFEMLNMIRQHYPNAQSLFMNNDTFESFKEFSVENKYRKKELPFLNHEEKLLYQHLTENNKRLEQERISQAYVQKNLPQ